MAIFQIDFYANSLSRTVPIKVILPTDKRTSLGQVASPAKFPTLYLLHGILGNDTDWITGTTIASLADLYNLCVVMPSGDNKFYVNSMKTGDMYSDFISSELPDFIERTFPVYKDKDHTYIAGLSMGGFGALLNGLSNHEKFGYIGAFSPALIKHIILNSKDIARDTLLTENQVKTIFDLEKVVDFENSNVDYEYIAKSLVDNKPRIWMATGTEDSLHEPGQNFAKLLEEYDFDITWSDWSGGHDWVFWQECIVKFIDWLPLEQAEAGISSGNVN